MRIEQIRQLLAIAEYGSMSKAAITLYMQQPNLSVSLKNIEEEFNQEFFTRTSSGMSLTPFGREFLSFAEAYYKQYTQLKKVGQADSDEPIEYFRVCGHHISLARWAMVDLCSEFADESVNILYENETYENIPESISSNKYDIGIIGILKHQQSWFFRIFKLLGLDFVPVCQSSFNIIVGGNHPFATSKLASVSLEQCKKYPFVMYTPMEAYLRSIPEYQHLKYGRTVFSLPDLMTVSEILNHSKAYAIGPHQFMFSTKIHALGSTLVEIPIEDFRADLAFGYLKRTSFELSQVGSRYIEILKNLCSLSL